MRAWEGFKSLSCKVTGDCLLIDPEDGGVMERLKYT